MTSIEELLAGNKVIPVVAFQAEEEAIPVCEALLESGISVIEITLRSEVALACVEQAVRLKPDLTIGVGTVLSPDQLSKAERTGADFLVSPGATPELRAAASRSSLPFLPGAATVSDIMLNLDAGFKAQKFFPASASGGPEFLKSVGSPLREARFCPTGGIDPANAGSYLGLQNVFAVGMSWIAPASSIENKDWRAIAKRAAEALAL